MRLRHVCASKRPATPKTIHAGVAITSVVNDVAAAKEGVCPTKSVHTSDVARPLYAPVPKAITASAEAMIIANKINAQPARRPKTIGTPRP